MKPNCSLIQIEEDKRRRLQATVMLAILQIVTDLFVMQRFAEIVKSTVLSYFLVSIKLSRLYQGMNDRSWERVISMARSRRHHMFCWSGPVLNLDTEGRVAMGCRVSPHRSID